MTVIVGKILATLARARILWVLLVLAGMAAPVLPAGPVSAAARPGAHPEAPHGIATPRTVHAPLAFELNQGQVAGATSFVARTPGYSLFLMPTGALFDLHAVHGTPRHALVGVHFVGANPRPRIVGVKKLQAWTNYFIGTNPSHWRVHVPLYARVEYRGVYPGIDLVYYSHNQQLEYDWVLHAGAHPGTIRLAVSGTNGVRLDRGKNLVLPSVLGRIIQKKATFYQQIGGEKRRVTGAYALVGKNQASFRAGPYDAHATLVIDPVIQYSTYVGGTNDDTANGVVADTTGNLYLVGDTHSTDLPSATNQCTVGPAGCVSVFIAKLNATTGGIVYTSYFGGTYYRISGRGIALDGSGNVFITGNYGSTDLPLATNSCIQSYGICMQNGYVARFIATTGALVYSTYVGGTIGESANAIAVDRSGDAYIAGTSSSTDMPHATNTFHPGSYTEAFVAKLTGATGAILSSTYVDGSSRDEGLGIALDSGSGVYITGDTTSTDMPAATNSCAVCPGQPVGFVAKIDSSTWTIVYSTYINASVQGRAIALDRSGNAFVTGDTMTPTGLPAATNSCIPAQSTSTVCSAAYVTKINGSSGAVFFSTYIGGQGLNQGYAVAVDGAGNPYVAGYTESPNMPNAVNTCAGGSSTVCPHPNSFVTKLLGASGAVSWSMYAGGNRTMDTFGVALDGAVNVYITGDTQATDLPNATNTCGLATGNVCFDAFVIKISTVVTIQARVGWNMVGGSPLTLWNDSQSKWSFNAATPAWYRPTGSETAGTGAWEYVTTAGSRTVTTVTCNAPVTVPVTAHRWNLVGNPCNRSVTLPSTAQAFWWDPTANHYVLVTSINPGAAAWVKPDSATLTLS
ncbi:MAG: SBBP repeat-containing protein [Chloroflexota bacterium]